MLFLLYVQVLILMNNNADNLMMFCGYKSHVPVLLHYNFAITCCCIKIYIINSNSSSSNNFEFLARLYYFFGCLCCRSYN